MRCSARALPRRQPRSAHHAPPTLPSPGGGRDGGSAPIYGEPPFAVIDPAGLAVPRRRPAVVPLERAREVELIVEPSARCHLTHRAIGEPQQTRRLQHPTVRDQLLGVVPPLDPKQRAQLVALHVHASRGDGTSRLVGQRKNQRIEMSDRLIRHEDTMRALEAGRFPRLVMVPTSGDERRRRRGANVSRPTRACFVSSMIVRAAA
jgi:hypothetical protein